ncbi:MAG: hypothetical protein GX327_05725 [Epulopiscium sp.]|nr:hypothetical protein [Candidatus Epulonipiscium sp.]
MYVAFDYIISKSKNISFNKIKSYQSFFDADNSSELVNLINSFLSKKKINLFKEIEIDIIKGSIYKIKRYFLENDKLKDIRGGSTIIII